MKARLVSLVIAAAIFGLGTASAVELNGKKGIGYARAIGGPSGLGFNFATGNLIVEGILGANMISPDKGDGSFSLGLGVGAHFQALRAENAALTAGARLNLGMTKEPRMVGEGGEQESITQFGLDIPVRVYWFADKHFSLHFEMGVSVRMNPEKGQLWNTVAGAKGSDITIFGDPSGAGPFGMAGGTFWF